MSFIWRPYSFAAEEVESNLLHGALFGQSRRRGAVSDSSESEDNLVDYDDKPTPDKTFSSKPLGESVRQEQSRFLKLPLDIFKCVVDYLDQRDAWSLKRTCRAMGGSEDVDKVMYRHPFQLDDVEHMRKGIWKYEARGRKRWDSFRRCINDTNRHHVQKLAMSHFSSVSDFQWIQDNLPSLTSLDLSSIMDFVFTPEETWTWKDLVEACPTLWSRIEEISVANWTDYRSHQRIQYSYSYHDYRYGDEFRLSRRRNGSGSVAKMVFPLCTKLNKLAICPTEHFYHTWNEYEVHQRSCVLVDGIGDYLPSTLPKLKIADLESFMRLFVSGASKWENLEEVEIDFFAWIKTLMERGEATSVGRPMRMVPGGEPRPGEQGFNDNTYHSCTRNHMDIGQTMIGTPSNYGPLFNLLEYVGKFKEMYPHVRLRLSRKGQTTKLNPLALINACPNSNDSPIARGLGLLAHMAAPVVVHIPQGALPAAVNTEEEEPAQPPASPGLQQTIRWLFQECGWQPLIEWDDMMCDVFPKNLGPFIDRHLLPTEKLISRIVAVITMLRSLGVPIRIILRGDSGKNIGIDPDNCNGALGFCDYKHIAREGENRKEVIAPSQARFNLAAIAPLVDEVIITYPHGVPGTFRAGRKATEAQKDLLRKEMKGWRRFWARYALAFTSLKKMTVVLPKSLFADWGKSESLRALLQDESWKVIDFEYAPKWRPSFIHPKGKFQYPKTLVKAYVSKVFFRVGDDELKLVAPEMTAEERERKEIPDEEIATKQLPPHRFWPAEEQKGRKRNLDKDGDQQERTEKKKVRAESN